jgi:hypothetical protein
VGYTTRALCESESVVAMRDYEILDEPFGPCIRTSANGALRETSGAACSGARAAGVDCETGVLRV